MRSFLRYLRCSAIDGTRLKVRAARPRSSDRSSRRTERAPGEPRPDWAEVELLPRPPSGPWISRHPSAHKNGKSVPRSKPDGPGPTRTSDQARLLADKVHPPF